MAKRAINTKLAKAFGKSVKTKRLKAGMTLRALSHECGINHVSILAIENAEVSTHLYTAYRIAKVLDIKIDSLLSEDL